MDTIVGRSRRAIRKVREAGALPNVVYMHPADLAFARERGVEIEELLAYLLVQTHTADPDEVVE